jgi:hypothetical protein
MRSPVVGLGLVFVFASCADSDRAGSGGSGSPQGEGRGEDDGVRAGALLSAPPSVAAPALRASEAAGAVPGHAAVSDQGRFTYKIPVDVPKGRAGMEPDLTLEYNSDDGNGPFGMGWSLSGGGAYINRCDRIWAAGQKTERIAFNTLDRFCLNGQQLLVTSGNYGKASSEYRTEIDSYAKIVLVSVASGGEPTEFKVYFKNGRIGTFTRPATLLRNENLNPDGTVFSTGNVNMSWPMTKLVDRSGNAMLYRHEERVDALPLLTRIDYTACDSGTCGYASARLRRVDFVPEDRSTVDRPERYVRGVRLVQTRRIKEIVVSVANSAGSFEPVHRYVARYAQSGVSGRTQLRGIKKCDGAATPVCLPETSFSWTGETAGPFESTPVGSTFTYTLAQLTPIQKKEQIIPENSFAVFDADGDGNDDIAFKRWTSPTLQFTSTAAPQDWMLFGDGRGYFKSGGMTLDADGDGLSKATTQCTGAEIMDMQNGQVADLDGDGRLEWLVSLNAGCPFVDADTSTAANFVRVQPGTSAGLTNVGAFARTTGTMAWDRVARNFRKVEMPLADIVEFNRSWVTNELKVLDMNGDGLPELLFASFNAPNGFWQVNWGSKTARTPAFEPQVGYVPRTLAKMAAVPDKANNFYYPTSYQVADEDGDGRQELLQTDHLGTRRSFFYGADRTFLTYRFRKVDNPQEASQHAVLTELSSMASPDSPQPPSWSAANFGAVIGGRGRLYNVDVNGDGLKDLLYSGLGQNSLWELRINTGNGYKAPTHPAASARRCSSTPGTAASPRRPFHPARSSAAAPTSVSASPI